VQRKLDRFVEVQARPIARGGLGKITPVVPVVADLVVGQRVERIASPPLAHDPRLLPRHEHARGHALFAVDSAQFQQRIVRRLVVYVLDIVAHHHVNHRAHSFAP
jgi:hypothetical protein